MAIQRDFVAFHQSLAEELRVSKDRIRQLIGDAHWLTDGEHKEAILRRLLRNHIAQSLHIGRGFVCGEGHSSSQIDILITVRHRPILFQDGELLIVTPDVVAAIIEVKTRVRNDLKQVLQKLADNAELIRSATGGGECPAGLFVYEPLAANDCGRLLEEIQAASRGEPIRVIDWVAAGPSLFVRHWRNGNMVDSPVRGQSVWHSYTLTDMSHAYFVSNVVWDTCGGSSRMQYAWFPVEGTKERHRERYIALDEAESHAFD